MKVFIQNGEVVDAVPDYLVYWHEHTINQPYTTRDIEETPGNQALCKRLRREASQLDDTGRRKFHLRNDNVEERQDFVEETDETSRIRR